MHELLGPFSVQAETGGAYLYWLFSGLFSNVVTMFRVQAMQLTRRSEIINTRKTKKD